MTSIAGTNIASRIAPFDTNDTFATHDAQWGRDGFRSVADTIERDSISTQRRKEGMLVYCVSGDATYQLFGGTSNSNWRLFTTGSGSISGSATLSNVYAASANSLIQSVVYANTVSGNLIQYVNTGSVSLASVAAASANAYQQSIIFTATASASNIIKSTSMSANAYSQSQVYTNTISGYVSNNIAGLSQSLSGYTNLIITSNLTGALQSQITSHQTTISILTSITGNSSTVSTSSNGYGTRYIQSGIFSDPGGINGDIVYVI